MFKSDYSYEIELSVIGSLIKFHDSLFNNIAVLSENDFLTPDVVEIFKIIKEIAPETDTATILSRIPPACRQTVIDSQEYVIGEHAFYSQMSRLLQLSQSRRLREMLTSVSLSVREVDLEEIKQIVEEETPKNKIFSAVYKADENLNKFINSVGVPQQRILTGYSKLDKLSGGLRIPAVSIIGALPSTGKTAIALNIIKNQPENVVLFSLEMSADMIYERMASDALSLNYDLFSKQSLSNEQIIAIKAYAETLRDKVFVYSDVYDIENQGAIISNIKPSLVVVDYIQKVQTSKRCIDRRNEIEYISGQYKQLAIYNKCHVMLLSQLSRNGSKDGRSGGIPSMSALKESGALEADGDYVMILHRPYVLDKNENPRETAFLVDKNKFGGTGLIEMMFFGEYQRFVAIDTQRDFKYGNGYNHNEDEEVPDLPF